MGDICILKDLQQMGFSYENAKELLENEFVQDTTAAVELLIKHPDGWRHKFNPKDSDSETCVICNDFDFEHVDS